jgi:TolB-like protein
MIRNLSDQGDGFLMTDERFAFGHFVFDRERKILLKAGMPVAAGHRALALLEALLAARGRTVSKPDLLEAAWRSASIEESNLSVQIATLRKHLGRQSDGSDWIATVQGVGYQFVLPAQRDQSTAKKTLDTVAQPPSEKPSIAVLPFENMSGDAEQDYFTDGMVEEITTALSRINQLTVIARNSSFVYKGRTVDVRQVGRELGVRYVLEGSVRKAAERVRITGQLIDTATGAHIWAERFDGDLASIFDLQDRVAASVVGMIVPRLELAEIDRVKRKPTASLDAYDWYLRGMSSFNEFSRDAQSRALASFNQAIELDSSFALPYAMAARCYMQRQGYGWFTDRGHEIEEAERLARRAAELGKDDATTLCSAGLVLAAVIYDLDHGSALIDRALALNPNLAWVWLSGSFAKIYLGEPEAALERAAHAMRLSPQDTQMFAMQTAAALGHFFAGRDHEALSWANRALQEQPRFVLAACVAVASSALARSAEAEGAITRLRKLQPALTLSNLKFFPLRRADDIARWTEGLRQAGLLE